MVIGYFSIFVSCEDMIIIRNVTDQVFMHVCVSITNVILYMYKWLIYKDCIKDKLIIKVCVLDTSAEGFPYHCHYRKLGHRSLLGITIYLIIWFTHLIYHSMGL